MIVWDLIAILHLVIALMVVTAIGRTGLQGGGAAQSGTLGAD